MRSLQKNLADCLGITRELTNRIYTRAGIKKLLDEAVARYTAIRRIREPAFVFGDDKFKHNDTSKLLPGGTSTAAPQCCAARPLTPHQALRSAPCTPVTTCTHAPCLCAARRDGAGGLR